MTQLQTWIERLDNTAAASSLKAEFQVVTPMFIGDGKQKADSIRPPAIKGALRFWWRALNWARCLNEAGGETAALNQLHNEEAALFGLAAKQDSTGNQQGGQGVFSLKVTQPKTLDKVENWPEGANGHCGYIGFGLWETGSSEQRNAIAEGTKFKVDINFKKQVNESLKTQIKQALVFLGLLGGLGSRARRGFGSIALTQIDDQSFVF
jgi:CRISPR-associated RAMP protein, Cmr1 family